jgi:predicted HAD superfamily Cof-like phosphohydrolase
MNNYQDVMECFEKFGIPRYKIPQFLDSDAQKFRVDFMKEELQEFIDSYEEGDLPTAFDSLIDLVYVAMGTAYMMGMDDSDWQIMWNDVQRANMEKERCTDESQSTRNSTLDVYKPEGWKAPRSKDILWYLIRKKRVEAGNNE